MTERAASEENIQSFEVDIMKTLLQLAGFASLILWAPLVMAVEGLQIRVQGNDVILEWPSAEEETFLISYRPTYATNDAWTWLATNLPATTGTNRTIFVHTNGAECAGGSMMMMSSGGGSESLSTSSSGSPFAGKSSWPSLADYELPPLPWSEKQQAYIAETYPGLLPLLPWDTQDQEWIVQMRDEAIAQQEGGGMALMSMSGGGCNPGGFYKVVKEGIHFFGLTNGTILSGEVELPVEVGLVDDREVSLLLYSGNAVADHSRIVRRSDGSVSALWNTAYAVNGTNKLHVRAVRGPDETVIGTTNTVLIANPVQLTSFTDTFGSQMWILSKLALTNADFEVRVFDAAGTNLGSFSGTTVNGFVSFTWDLTVNGIPIQSPHYRLQFRVAPPGTPLPSNPSTTQITTQEAEWDGDDFVIAWGEFEWADEPNRRDYLEEMIQQNIVDLLGDLFADFPYELSDGNLLSVFGGGTYLATPANLQTLTNSLAAASARNFWWGFHGNANNIGYPESQDSNETPIPGTGVKILQSDIEAILGNKNGTNNHPYRFVFLHGCNTADGELPKAFGIETLPVSIEEYLLKGMRPRAFIGSLGECTSMTDEASVMSLGRAYARFYVNWMSGAYSVQECLSAGQTPDGIFPSQPLPQQFTVYGAEDMRRID